MHPIYLDNAATTQPWPEVIAAMHRVMAQPGFGNASSLHRWGRTSARVVEQAGEVICETIGSGKWRVVFTSGGTEADTLAVLGSVPKGKRDSVVTTIYEHAAVSESCKRAVQPQGQLVCISGGRTGVVDPRVMAAAVGDRTALVSVAHVAAEMGTVQPVVEIASLAKAASKHCLVHVDAVQALAQCPALDYPAEVDMVSISGHKIHGPTGIGALLIRPNVHLKPILFGGDQQGGLRPGTLPVANIAGFGAAIQILSERRAQGVQQMRDLTDRLVREVVAGGTGVRPLGDWDQRAPGMAILAVAGVPSEVLLHALEARHVIAASGSACHATKKSLPKSLIDAGLGQGEGALRLSLSIDTRPDDVDTAIPAIIDAITAVRTGKAG
ncbi:MAG: cysteine desulfurase family protein [Myxococcota bacterium]|nr:cysteine desulfurase family protein [Myxococcota bacterium]